MSFLKLVFRVVTMMSDIFMRNLLAHLTQVP